MTPTIRLTSNHTTDYHISQTFARAKYSVHCSSFWRSANCNLNHNFLSSQLSTKKHFPTTKAERTPLVTLLCINCPCLSDASKTAPPLRVPRRRGSHLCRWQRALPTPPSLIFAGGSRKNAPHFLLRCV